MPINQPTESRSTAKCQSQSRLIGSWVWLKDRRSGRVVAQTDTEVTVKIDGEFTPNTVLIKDVTPVSLVGAGHAFGRQKVCHPRLGLAKTPKATPYVGGRPNPSVDYTKRRGQTVRRTGVAYACRYVEASSNDTSGWSPIHDLIAGSEQRRDLEVTEFGTEPTSAQETITDAELKAELKTECRVEVSREEAAAKQAEVATEKATEERAYRASKQGEVMDAGETPDEQAAIISAAWGIRNGKRTLTPAEKRDLQQRLSAHKRFLWAVGKLRVVERLRGDVIAKRLGKPRSRVREALRELEALPGVGPHAVRLPRELARNGVCRRLTDAAD